MTTNIQNVSVYRGSADAGAPAIQPRERAPAVERSENQVAESDGNGIEEAMESFNAQLAKQNLSASYSVSPETQTITINLVNRQTGDVVRTIPAMPLASATARLSRGMGALIDGYL